MVETQNIPADMNEAEEVMFNEYLSNRICRKNPGHPTFIPLSDIRKSILPPEARHDVIVQILKDTGMRSVKLTVYYTTDRPQKFSVGLPAHSRNGRIGTGWVELFDQTVDKLPGYIAGQTFVISTAAHVVFDKYEAKNTKVEFFYDVDGDKSDVVAAWGVSLILVNTTLDACRFMCKTDSKEGGHRIVEKMRSVHVTYPHLPPLKNIAWCISHPHGFSKRLTLGKVTRVVEDAASWACNLLQLLVFRCCIKNSLDEKKVYYMFFKESLYGIDTYITKQITGIKRLEQKQTYLKHLLANKLITRPTETDYLTIKANYAELLDTIYCERNSLRDQQPVEPLSVDRDKNECLLQYVVKKMSLQTPKLPNFRDTFESIEKAIFAKKHEVIFGIQCQHGELTRIKCIVYDLDSCPGSSGARVTAYLRTPMGCRRFMGFHSRGLDGYQGNMCGGGGSRIVPTLPISPPQPRRQTTHHTSSASTRWSVSESSF